MEDFLLRAMLAAIGIVLITGPLGCMLIWRRMAYFADATGHASVAGVAVAMLLSIAPFYGVIITALTVALVVHWLSGEDIAEDAILGVVSYTGVATGIVIITAINGVSADVLNVLVGDILAVGWQDVLIIWLATLTIGGILAWRWAKMLTATLDSDLAYASGINPRQEKLLLLISIAVVIAVSIKVVGGLLIGALLIIPAAAARMLANGPETMAILSAAIGIFAVFGGISLSWSWDWPAGPSIVAVCGLVFGAIVLFAKVAARENR